MSEDKPMHPKNPFVSGDALADVEARMRADPVLAAKIHARRRQIVVAAMVRDFRKSKGLPQEQLAGLVGTKQASIARLESGRVEPSLGLLWKIAEATGQRLAMGFEPDVQGRRSAPRAKAARVGRKRRK